MAIPLFVSGNEADGFSDGSDLPIELPFIYGAGDVVAILVMTTDPSHTVSPGDSGFALVATTSYGAPSGHYRLFRKAMAGTEGTSVSLSVNVSDETFKWVAVAYSGAAPATYKVATNSSNNSFEESWTSPSYNAVVQEVAVSFIKAFTGYWLDPGSTLRSSSIAADIVAVDKITGPGTTAGSTIETTGDYSCAITLGMRPLNSAPYAPALNWPTLGEVIDVASPNEFLFTFLDPDFDLPRPEGQLKYEIRYRSTSGSPPWTTLTPAPTAIQKHLFAAATFLTGTNYEWQVRCYDLAGEAGPWSPSGLFTGGTAPAAAVITDPTVDELIESNSVPVAWTGVQTGYQVRTVADNAGLPDPSQVYFNPGPVLVSAAHTAPVQFLTNNRTEHIQVRLWNGTLWSPWTSVRVHVAYTPPPAPVVTLSTDPVDGSLVVTYDTPAPTGGQPTPTYVDIWVDDGEDIPNERKVTGLPIDGEWKHMTPRGDRDYEPYVHVIAYTADGIPSAAVGVLTLILDSPTRGLLDINVLA